MIRDTEYKISLNVDDVLVCLRNLELGIPRLMDLLQVYGAQSGYTLNIDKTQALVFNFTLSFGLKRKDNFNWEQIFTVQ